MKHNRILLLLLVLFFGCDEDESTPPSDPITVFSITVEPDYPLSKDDWIMVHDKNGILLDHKQIEEEGVFEFKTSAPVPDGRIGITVFKYDTTGNIHSYSFDSYLAVPTGQGWTWKKPVTPPVINQGPSVGTFSATYTLPSPLRMDLFGNTVTLGGFSQSGDTKYYQSTIFEKNRNFLLTIASNGNPRYMLFENVENGDHVEVTFDEMQEYDKILDISFPPAVDPFVKVTTMDDNGWPEYYTYYNGYNLPPFAPSATLTNLKIGYLNRFEKYYTTIAIPSTDFNFSYEKVGSAPSAINFPDHAYHRVIDKTLANFSYSNEVPFSMRRSSFKDDSVPDKQIWWSVYAPEGTDKITELPQPFVELYSFIKIQNFKHLTSSFLSSTRTYIGYVDRVGKGISEIKEYEATTIIVR